MNPNEYQKQAMQTQADQSAIHERHFELGVTATQLDNALRGLTDEVGEIASCIKNWIEYGKELDKINLIEEIGDSLYRLSQMCDAIGTNLEFCMKINIAKLKERYPNGFTNHDAAEENRDREAEREVLEKEIFETVSRKEKIAALEQNSMVEDVKKRIKELEKEYYPKPLEQTGEVLEKSKWITLDPEVKKTIKKLNQYDKSLEQTGAGFAEPPEEDEVPTGPNMTSHGSTTGTLCPVCRNNIMLKQDEKICFNCIYKIANGTLKVAGPIN